MNTAMFAYSFSGAAVYGSRSLMKHANLMSELKGIIAGLPDLSVTIGWAARAPVMPSLKLYLSASRG